MFSKTKQGKRPKGGRSSEWHQKLLKKWNVSKCCTYCGVETKIYDKFHPNRDSQPDAATLDHVYSNLDLRRLLDGGKKTVLACYRCNNKRNAMETRRVYENKYDKRNNKISIIEMLKSLTN